MFHLRTLPAAADFVATSGLGKRFLTGVWVDLDERKRPKGTPKLFGWTTPQGWREGQRPRQEIDATASNVGAHDVNPEVTRGLIHDIEGMADVLGKRLYRGVLKVVARAWSPSEIREMDVLRKVLEHMQSAERGLRRLEVALDRVGPETLVPILRSLRLNSLDQVDSLESLKKIVLAVERAAQCDR
jgi:hypothetical protein